ncbi:hypothetical protein [Streptomyces europaeiscabiei]|uniref:hypothetical protein n=1 Tax=Streptomyces europaeiscabiei TaxID=146819 RepID=UPI002E0FC44C|nr:hypothetical protein OHB30_33055 [Streptomyces europaeiscabiei]
MSWRDLGRVVFGSSQPTHQPSVPSTRDLEKLRKQSAKRNAKEAEQAAGRRARHRASVLRNGDAGDGTKFAFEEKRFGRRS